jgi:hypothetical protein
MLGMEQLHHAQVHFATAAEALFKQSMRTKIHIRPRQSAEGLQLSESGLSLQQALPGDPRMSYLHDLANP